MSASNEEDPLLLEVSESPTIESEDLISSGLFEIPNGIENHSIESSTFDIHTFKTRLNYYIPVIGWLPKYEWASNFQNDLIAGITVACILIPQSLSFAQALVKIPPVYGLYSCFIPVLVYGLFGTSRQLSFGPEALVSILTGSTISEYLKAKHGSPIDSLDSDEENILYETISLANFMALLVGFFTFLLGFFRLGFLDSVLSRSLLRGFINAVAFVVMIELGEKLLGIPVPMHDKPDESPFECLLKILSNLHLTNTPTILLSFCSISFIFIAKQIKKLLPKKLEFLKLIPEILVLVVVTTSLSAYFKWDELGIVVLKDVEGGLKAPSLPTITIGRFNSLFLSAALISLIGYVESIAVSKTYASKHNYSISPNRELVAIGLSNITGSFFGAWPVFGSLGRSAVNDNAGARTQMSGLITSFLILLSTFFLLPYLYYLPKAVCSSIIVSAAVTLIEIDELSYLLRLKAWKDIGLLLLTFLTTLFVSIEAGTIVSIGFSLLLVVKHSTAPQISILGRTVILDQITKTPKVKFRSISESKDAEQIPGVLIIRFDQSLYFGNVSYLKERLNRVEKFGRLNVHPGETPLIGSKGSSHTPIQCVIFDFSSCFSIDASAIHALMHIIEVYNNSDIQVYAVKVQTRCLEKMDRAGLLDLIDGRVANKIQEALILFNRSQTTV